MSYSNGGGICQCFGSGIAVVTDTLVVSIGSIDKGFFLPPGVRGYGLLLGFFAAIAGESDPLRLLALYWLETLIGICRLGVGLMSYFSVEGVRRVAANTL